MNTNLRKFFKPAGATVPARQSRNYRFWHKNPGINRSVFSIPGFLISVVILINYSFSSEAEPCLRTYYVSVKGSDSNPGTITEPFASLEAARNAARMAEGVPRRIVVLPGEYFLEEHLKLDQADNGLIIEAGKKGSVTLYGGRPVEGWKRKDDKLWYADLPGISEGSWEFRSLVVDGRLAEKARYPESGFLLHRQEFNVRVVPAIAGWWERQPTPEELRKMAYDPEDIPENFDIRNAEIRVYHMWDESFVGIEHNDQINNVFKFSSPATYPPGAFGKKEYIIFNTREGMTKPGQWYLDKTNGRLVYWPKEDEDMSQVKIIAPALERIIAIHGEPGNPAENITIRNLALQATTTPLRAAGFGGRLFDGAIDMIYTSGCSVEDVTVSNVGGLGIRAISADNCTIARCHIFNTGACGLKIRGNGSLVANNHIHDLGLYYPSSAAFYAPGNQRLHIYRNTIHDAPYSGIITGRSGVIVEENLVYRVMKELQDGGAIYMSGGDNIILRRNVVRDIVSHGAGYGVSAYYFDEGAHDCIAEGNVSIGVPRPTHNHICHDIIMRDNLFIHDGDMILSFQNSANYTFSGNTIITGGKLTIGQPNALKVWEDNLIFYDDPGGGPALIDSEMPVFTVPQRKNFPAVASRIEKRPVLGGGLISESWPGDFYRLDREPSGLSYSGAPVQTKFSYDRDSLYIAAAVTMFKPEKLTVGNIWGKDDGMEIFLGGGTAGTPVNIVLQSFPDGTLRCITGPGTPAGLAGRLENSIRFESTISYERRGGGWTGWWAVPLDLLGIDPAPGLRIPFNMCAFVNEFDNWKCWEGGWTGTEVSEGTGMLLFE
jgi:hypothetical protein